MPEVAIGCRIFKQQGIIVSDEPRTGCTGRYNDIITGKIFQELGTYCSCFIPESCVECSIRIKLIHEAGNKKLYIHKEAN
jgi:hypothetical protein